MASNPPVKLKWLEHLNTSWVTEDCETIAVRDGIISLYERLLSNKEVISMPQQVLHLKGPSLPDFEIEAATLEEQEHFLNALLSSQLALARAVCSDSPFAAILQKRLVVLQRIFHAVVVKYHDREKLKQQQQLQDAQASQENCRPSTDKSRSGTEALIEMGVRTGLSLCFSLLKQNWTLTQASGGSLCNDVIRTASDVVCTLPPLSLANESKLPSLGLETLNQITQFLKGATLPNSGADTLGKRLASELVLALAAQRGSLRYLLEWIEMALCASAASKLEPSVPELPEQPGMITLDVFMDILHQMKKSAVGILGKE